MGVTVDWMTRWKLWDAKRQQVLQRAKGLCERCRQVKAEHVHHLRYFTPRDHRHQAEEPLSWLQALCVPCHNDQHPGFRMRSNQHRKDRKAARAQRQAAKPNTRQAGCAHCGGTYTRKRHAAICLKHGLAHRRP